MKTLEFNILIALMSISLVVSYMVVASKLTSFQDNFDKENTCIAKYVRVGIERKDLVRASGTCYIKKKGR